MFDSASKFNQNVSSWKVENVKDMRRMFWHAVKFNQNVSSWKVANVKDMGSVFWHADNFNQDLSDWAVSADTNTRDMFDRTPSLDPKPRWYKE